MLSKLLHAALARTTAPAGQPAYSPARKALRFLDLGSRHRCEMCGSWNMERGWWSRGRNNWLEQAYGDAGSFCQQCGHITFDTPDAEHVARLPHWCTPYTTKQAVEPATPWPDTVWPLNPSGKE